MSKIQFDVNVAYGFAIDFANNVLSCKPIKITVTYRN